MGRILFAITALVALSAPVAHAAPACSGATLIGGEWHGTAGNDVIDCSDAPAYVVVNGAAGDDVVHGSAFADQILGSAGSDTLYGGPGADRIWADYDSTYNSEELIGANFIYGQGGNDEELVGGFGNDLISGGGGDDYIIGNKGDDTLDPGPGLSGWVFGDLGCAFGCEVTNFGTDTLRFDGATKGVAVNFDRRSLTGWSAGSVMDVEIVHGTAFADTISGAGSADTFFGAGGRDTLKGAGSADHLDAGSGTDVIDGGEAADTCLNGERLKNCP